MLELENIETVLPGVVTNVGDGVVDCKACIRKVAPNGVFDVLNLEIPKIPLMKLGGANAEITFPTKEGDQVLLVAFSRDSSLWRKDYSDDSVPESSSGLTLSDFVAVPFIAGKKVEGAAKIRVTEDGDIVMTPATGRRVVSDADLLVRGKVQSTDDVQAGVTEAGGEVIATGGISLQLHTHPTAVVGAPSTPTPIVGG
jgi:hypothetical protein